MNYNCPAYLNSPDSCLSNITGAVQIRVINPTMTAKGTAKVENTSPSEGPTSFAVPPKINAGIETSTLYSRKGIYRRMKIITKVTATIATQAINQTRMKLRQGCRPVQGAGGYVMVAPSLVWAWYVACTYSNQQLTGDRLQDVSWTTARICGTNRNQDHSEDRGPNQCFFFRKLVHDNAASARAGSMPIGQNPCPTPPLTPPSKSLQR
jgi:hypothetical protein